MRRSRASAFMTAIAMCSFIEHRNVDASMTSVDDPNATNDDQDPKRRSLRRRDHRAALVRAAMCTPEERPRAETVGEVLDAYVAELRRCGRPSLPDVISGIECWLRPALGDLRPAECTAPRVAELVRIMREAGCAANTIRTKCSFARSALAYAAASGLIERNPIDNLRNVVPKKRPRAGFAPRRELLTVHQFAALVTDDRIPGRDRALYLLLGGCGLRAGEAFALRVGDIDRSAPELAALHVVRQWSRKLGRLGPPKSGTSRVVPLHPSVLGALDVWIDSGLGALLGRAPGPDDLLLPDPRRHNGFLVDRKALIRFRRHLAIVGLEARRLHSLRHTFFSHLLDVGVPKDVVAQFTHPARYDSAVDAYAHYSWRVLCEARRRTIYHFALVPSNQLELFPKTEV